VPYELRTELVGVAARHADGCPARLGSACLCGPLGYRARIWDWDSSRWLQSPLLNSPASARNWQREANRAVEVDAPEEEQADPAEKLFWWAFCYVGLGFVGVAVALFTSDIAG
jgi:hypothetical protein